MYTQHWSDAGSFINMPLFMAPFVGLVLIAALWSLVWKGLALWHSAQRGEYWWFMVLLLVNTLGILEIIYLFFFAKVKADSLFKSHTHTHHH